MSLSFDEREKLVKTLQKTFPFAQQWAEVKNSKKTFPIKTNELLRLPIGALMFGSSSFGCGALSLAAFTWSNHLSSSESGGTLFGFLMFGVGLALGALTLALTSYSVAYLYNAYEIKKLKNKTVEYKKMVRDYVAQKTSVRKVQEMLPRLSDSDLKLLHMHPNLNSVFKKHFEKEFKRREALETVEKINAEFLLPQVAVETECLDQETFHASVVKVNI